MLQDKKLQDQQCFYCGQVVCGLGLVVSSYSSICCTICANLREDDYDLEEFSSLRSHMWEAEDVCLLRRSTSDAQRVLLETAFARWCFPEEDEICQLVLGLGWSRDRVLKWFANKRAFPNRARRIKRSTSDAQRSILEAAFASDPEPDIPNLNRLGGILNWSEERVLKWFRNKRNYRARRPKRSRSDQSPDDDPKRGSGDSGSSSGGSSWFRDKRKYRARRPDSADDALGSSSGGYSSDSD